MIKVENVIKKYGKSQETLALKGINLEFPDKGLISILGPSGCGKSTLLNLLGLLDRPTEGDVLIDGISTKGLRGAKKDSLRNETIGFIFQSYHLIPTLSLINNVILPLEIDNKDKYNIAKEKGITLLKKFGLGDFINKKTNDLSGGQKQRVAICRALINNPKIILADEPTGALDSENSEEVLKILKEISKERLVILVTHNNEQAYKYSDRIITLKDGNVVSDTNNEVFYDDKYKFALIDEKHKLMKTKNICLISARSFLSKKFKTLLTSTANCFGLVALGFVLALTNGFTIYKDKVDAETASNLPINVPAYSIKTDTESWKDINQSQEYPNTEEIYPYVKTSSTVTYTYNNYSSDYFKLLDQIVSSGLASEYLFNYGNSYTYNLTTEFPASLDGVYDSYINEVSTSLSAGGSYTSSTYGIPTNIFHVLYGDIDSGYDLLYGSLPKNKNELVLVVNEYNSINFATLQNLGFYSKYDTSDEVKDTSLESKVKPIGFSDIVGKKYKIFTNDELYTKLNVSGKIDDQFSYKNGVNIPNAHSRTLSMYAKNDYDTIFDDPNIGVELTISGIIRPKKDSTLSLISPSLCFLSELQEDLNESKKNSNISKEISSNLVYISDNPTSNLDIIAGFTDLLESYNNDISAITTTEINDFANKYFKYYLIDSGNKVTDDEDQLQNMSFKVSNFSYFLNQSKKLGVDLVLEETKEALSSGDKNRITDYVNQVFSYFRFSSTADKAYENFISLIAYMNSYSDITNIAIFPTGLNERTLILNELDAFNDSRRNDSEKIYYLDVTNSMIEQVGDMVSLISFVLLIFVVVLIVVACVMNILFTYNNVLERKKDIGIFRAVGMRKFDVSRVFVFEASLIGLLSGIMGVVITFILEVPVNYAVKSYYETYYKIGNICILSWWHIILIIILGLLLGVLSAIIPSYNAANKDPVECLKDE